MRQKRDNYEEKLGGKNKEMEGKRQINDKEQSERVKARTRSMDGG